MKCKLTYCLLALLLPVMAWGVNYPVTVTGYHGTYQNPFQTETMSYIRTNPEKSHSDSINMQFNPELTVYAVEVKRLSPTSDPGGSVGCFTLIPTAENPYLALWFAVESNIGGPAEHEEAYGSVAVYDTQHTLLGCFYHYATDNLMTDKKFKSSPGHWGEYVDGPVDWRNWDVSYINLKQYVGQKITIEAVATTCSNQRCASEVYVAFEGLSSLHITQQQICSTCNDATLNAPIGLQFYDWHKGSVEGPIVGHNEPLYVRQDQFTTYYCVPDNYCGTCTYVYPMIDAYALFETSTHCGTEADTVYLTNLSYIHERVAPYKNSPATGAHWDFGDGRTSDDPNLQYIVYPKSKKRQYTITLQAGNADLSCAATVSHTVEVCPVDDTTPLNPEILDCEPDSVEITRTICDKQLPYTWKDQTCTQAGDYTFDTLNVLGCDSVITLHLFVDTYSAEDTTAFVCFDDLPFIWHGKEAVDGDTIKLINRVGCDSIVTLRLTIGDPMTTQTIDTTVCDTLMPILWRGYTFTKPGEYRDTIRNSKGCDQTEYIYRLDTVHCEAPLPPEPPKDTCLADIVYKKWEDVIFCDNGRHEFVAFQWYKDSVIIIGETKQYLYQPAGFGNAEYQVEVTYTDGTKLRTCPITFTDAPRSAETYVHIQTIIPHGTPLHIEHSDATAEVEIYAILGQHLYHASIGKTADLKLTLPTGVYLLTLKGQNVHSTTKIMVQ